VGLDHVQLACPAGSEGRLCSFYAGLLGMEEVPKPPALATRGGAWFRAGTAEVHLGVEEPFRPARKAHPGLVVDDVGAVAARLTEAGHAVRWDDAVPGRRRFHTDDPVGNRVEILGRRPLGEAGGCGSARPSGALQGTCAW
jgi:catechol 2,3-dioxygenase-like lactoylglutathione lyase family enzyme